MSLVFKRSQWWTNGLFWKWNSWPLCSPGFEWLSSQDSLHVPHFQVGAGRIKLFTISLKCRWKVMSGIHVKNCRCWRSSRSSHKWFQPRVTSGKLATVVAKESRYWSQFWQTCSSQFSCSMFAKKHEQFSLPLSPMISKCITCPVFTECSESLHSIKEERDAVARVAKIAKKNHDRPSWLKVRGSHYRPKDLRVGPSLAEPLGWNGPGRCFFFLWRPDIATA